jgi:predicted enzyme related to lactoylglutathione lyase
MRLATHPRGTSPRRAGSTDIGAAPIAARQRSYGPGVHCWTELRTNDVARATRFYADVFGWTARASGIRAGQPYSTLQIGRVPIAGVSARADEALPGDKGAAFWRLYAAVMVRSSLDGGGRARPESAARQLPAGAAFAAERASLRYASDEAANDLAPPFVLWIDADGADPRAAASFCREFFRDADEQDESSDRSPLLLHNADAPAPTSGLTIMAGDTSGLPVFSVGFVVRSCDEVARRAEAAGGRVVTESAPIGALGSLVTLVDPQGATFACWEPTRASGT